MDRVHAEDIDPEVLAAIIEAAGRCVAVRDSIPSYAGREIAEIVEKVVERLELGR